MTENDSFESRKLYSQECYVDETLKVKSNVYAISYRFQGSINPITARCRTTVVFNDTAGDFSVQGGTIEKWSDKGWQTIDEYFDAFVAFSSSDEALEFMLAMFKSFTMGAPMNLIPTKTSPPPSDPKPDRAPNIRVLSFAKEKAKSESSKTKKPSESDDTPDFDWI